MFNNKISISVEMWHFYSKFQYIFRCEHASAFSQKSAFLNIDKEENLSNLKCINWMVFDKSLWSWSFSLTYVTGTKKAHTTQIFLHMKRDIPWPSNTKLCSYITIKYGNRGNQRECREGTLGLKSWYYMVCYFKTSPTLFLLSAQSAKYCFRVS